MKSITRSSITAKKSRRVAKLIHVKNKKNQILKLNELLARIVTEVEGKRILENKHSTK